MNERFRILCAVMVMVFHDNKVLLMQRKNTGFGDNFWGLPGGGIDGGESLQSAACRELFEELDITVTLEELSFTGLIHVAPYFRTPHESLLACFATNSFKGTLNNKEPHKCHDIAFFACNELPSNILEGSLTCIQNYQSHNQFSQLHWKI